jgi:hypothetical protein
VHRQKQRQRPFRIRVNISTGINNHRASWRVSPSTLRRCPTTFTTVILADAIDRIETPTGYSRLWQDQAGIALPSRPIIGHLKAEGHFAAATSKAATREPQTSSFQTSATNCAASSLAQRILDRIFLVLLRQTLVRPTALNCINGQQLNEAAAKSVRAEPPLVHLRRSHPEPLSKALPTGGDSRLQSG